MVSGLVSSHYRNRRYRRQTFTRKRRLKTFNHTAVKGVKVRFHFLDHRTTKPLNPGGSEARVDYWGLDGQHIMALLQAVGWPSALLRHKQWGHVPPPLTAEGTPPHTTLSQNGTLSLSGRPQIILGADFWHLPFYRKPLFAANWQHRSEITVEI